MSDDLTPIAQPSKKTSLGDRIRNIASQLRQESEIQIKATSRILGAAAQIAQNHDQLIDDVVEMVEEDLDQQEVALQPAEVYTADNLKQQFKTLKDAKEHFGIKVTTWAALVDKLNGQSTASGSSKSPSQDSVIQRLEGIEQEVHAIRRDVNQILNLLTVLLKD